jgi:hypothetical protein
VVAVSAGRNARRNGNAIIGTAPMPNTAINSASSFGAV